MLAIATEQWVKQQGYSKYTGPGNSYVHFETGQNLSITATDAGIVIRKDGVVLGSLLF